MPKSRLKILEECYLVIMTCPTIWYQIWENARSVDCLICGKRFKMSYLNSDDLDEFCQNKPIQAIRPTKFDSEHEEKLYRNFYSFFYRDVIDNICKACKDTQNLLPSPEFYLKLDVAIKDRWGI